MNSFPLEHSVAIVGMAGRFPGAPNVEAYWQNLKEGVESITRFTDEELETPAALRENPAFVRARGIVSDVDLFDADFFAMNPREAEFTDPQHRLLLETAWEALENAGCDPGQYEGSIGIFAGCSQNTYLLHNLASNPRFLAEYLAWQQMGAHPALLGNDKDFLTTRVAYKLNLRGPSVAVQSACSTSLVAVCQAVQSLLAFQCDFALAGGVSITFPQRRGYLYEEGSIVSRDGHCRPFDVAADGTVFGDGVGLVALKRADEAVRDGDHIYAIVGGAAVNNDGSGKISYMAPSVEGQYEVIATAQAVSGVPVETIGYVEAHGTGTALGDPIEVAALTKAFRAETTANQFCILGAAKGNIGHLEAAAGVAGLIKAALAVSQGEIPPTLHFSQPNAQIDFAKTPFRVSSKLEQWPIPNSPRRAGVSSFGVGGTNAHLVLEEAPLSPRPSPRKSPQLLVLSARTKTALDAVTQRLAGHLENCPEAELADVAHTLQVGRRAFSHRRMVVAESTAEAVEKLRSVCSTGLCANRAPKVAFFFPGQGAQHVGMGRVLYEHEPIFRTQVDRCCELLKPELKLDLRDILYPKVKPAALDDRLTQTALTQPALFVVEFALAQVWLARGVRPHVLAGHSLGEYVAATLAGVFRLEDALHLLAVRGRLMQELAPGAMLAVALSEADLKSRLGAGLAIAAVNGPRSCVVSGETKAIEAWRETLAADGIGARELKTSHAFHSTMMDPILERFESEVAKVERAAPTIPIISSLHGRLGTAAEWMSPAYWSAQLRQTVRFADAMTEVLADENVVGLEVGPGQTLAALARQSTAWTPDRTVIASLSRPEDGMLPAMGQLWLTGVNLRWSDTSSKARRVALPTYPFERKRFWIEPTKSVENVEGEVDLLPPMDDTASIELPKAPRQPHPSVVEALIDEQLAIMSRQLEALRHVAVGKGAE